MPMNKKKTYKKKTYTKPSLKKAVRVAVKREINRHTEIKEKIWDTTINGQAFTSIDNSGSAIGLTNSLTQGTGNGNRIGDSVRLKSLRFDYIAAAGDATNVLRMIIVTPRKKDIGSSFGAIIQNVLYGTRAVYKPIDTDLYTVLYDKMTYAQLLASGTTPTYSSTPMYFKGYINLRDVEINYDTSGNPNRDVFVILISDSVAISHPGLIQGYMRLKYYD